MGQVRDGDKSDTVVEGNMNKREKSCFQVKQADYYKS